MRFNFVKTSSKFEKYNVINVWKWLKKKIAIATKLNKFQKFNAAKTMCNKKNNQNIIEAIINPRNFANIESLTIDAMSNFISN